jgi:outer membrane protein OmpA-like peptidoglycan-associated protein
MSRQSQWLFETPFTLKTIPEINPYPALELEAEWRPSNTEETKEMLMVTKAISAGNQNEKLLTDLVFFARHPKLPRRELNSKNVPSSQKLKELVQEWLEIRNTVVRYAIKFKKCTDASLSCQSKCSKGNYQCIAYCQGAEQQCIDDISIANPKRPTSPAQKKPTPPPKKSTTSPPKKPGKGLIDIEMANLEYYHPELESEWELQDGSHYSYPLGEEEWEQAPSCPDRNNLAIWISRFARYGNTIQALPREEQARIGQIARYIISSYGSGCQPIRTIRLIGHADRDPQRGSAFEKKISGDRAQVVQEALIRAINNPKISQQITWQRTAEGASRLIVRNPKTESDRSRNRRVEVILITSPSLQRSCAEECERDFQRCLQTPSTREQCLRQLRSCRSDCRGRPV